MKRSPLLFLIVIIPFFIISDAETTTNNSIKETKRYKLFEYAYGNLNKIVWSERVYQEMNIYLNDLKQWSFNNSKTFDKSNIYLDLQGSIGTNLNILNELQSDRDNCKKQMNLKMEHDRLKMFQGALLADPEDENVLREWMEKDRVLLRKLLAVTIRPYKNFYVKLQAEVEIYINGLDDSDEMLDVDDKLQKWLKKFIQETDFVEKLFLITEFMGLFEKEKSIWESECMLTH